MIDTGKHKAAADVPAPLSAYNLFLKDMRARIDRGELELKDKKNFLAEASALWATISEAEKDAFRETSRL